MVLRANGLFIEIESHDISCLFIMATKATNTNSTPRKQTKKGFTFPSIPAYSLSLSLSLIFILSPISSYNVIILLPHLTIFSLCCSLVLWSIHLTLYMCSQFCILSWWTTISSVSNSLFFVVIVGILRYMKFNRSSLRHLKRQSNKLWSTIKYFFDIYSKGLSWIKWLCWYEF